MSSFRFIQVRWDVKGASVVLAELGSDGSWKGPNHQFCPVGYQRGVWRVGGELVAATGCWRCLAVSDDGDGAVFGVRASRVCRMQDDPGCVEEKGVETDAGRVPRENKRAGKGVEWMAQISNDLVEDRRKRVLGVAAEERAGKKAGGGGGERDRKWEEPNGGSCGDYGVENAQLGGGNTGTCPVHGALRSLDGRCPVRW